MHRSAGFVVLLLLLGRISAQAADEPAVTVQQNASPAITLDGKLDEPEWQHAPVLHLVQQSPKPGAPTPFATEVRIIVGADRVYFGFTCHDATPQRLAIHGMQRDGDLSGDDGVSLVLDTYGDRRTGY